jgi:hypothetical protein
VKPLLDRIRDLTIEVGECWEWQGAVQSNSPVPTMNYKGKVAPVRRHIAEERGVPLQDKLATHSCGNQLCVNPDHVVLITRKRLQARIAKETLYQLNAIRRKRLSDNARTRSKLTLEVALQIRDAEGTQRQIAAQFGVSQATVSAIKLGKTWRDYNNPFSQLFPFRTK